MTDRCNARCPQCGMRATEKFTRSTLQTEKIKETIDAAAEKGVAAVSFTGGEPLLDLDRLLELIRYAGDAGIPFIRTGTNGFIFANSEKRGFEKRIERIAKQLADTSLRNFWISLDSAVDKVHEKMRGFSGIVAGMEKALPIFHENGIYPAANLGINRNVGGRATRGLKRGAFASQGRYLEVFYARYQHALERFYRRAIALGFTMANTCYPMSIDEEEEERGLAAVYAATTVEDVVRFDRMEKQTLFKALIRAIERYRSKIRIFSPICSLEALVRQYGDEAGHQAAYGCRGGVDFFFVNAADGHTYPCGYRGAEDFGSLSQVTVDQLKPMAEGEACRQCDWECFRDPSEMMGPLLEAFANPLGWTQRFSLRPRAIGTWFKDLAYYNACDLFDGRRPLNTSKLNRYALLFGRREKKRDPLSEFSHLNKKLSVS